MARTELHSDRMPPIEQRATLIGSATGHDEVVTGENISSVDGSYMADIAMMEEPVTIRIEPSSDKNAATSVPIWVNGKGAECFINGRWVEIIYLPVGMELIVKRKYLGVLISAKTDTVNTRVIDMESERPNNVVSRQTTAVASFTVIQDNNPRGHAWAQELRRRQM